MRIIRQIIMLLSLMPLNVDASVEVLGSLICKYSAQKGETYSTVFKVQNSENKDQEVRIYLQDYLFNYEGLTFYKEPGSHRRSNTLWIQYNPKTLLLKGNETQNIQFEVTVPKSDTLVGTYWSVLMVEGVSSPNPSLDAKGQIKINESIRYAIQIITSIGKTGIGVLEFQQPGIVKEGDKSFFDFILLNTGERLISPDVSMELIDVSTGTSVKVLKALKNGMYPTTSTKWRFPLEGIPKGKTYKAVIVADGSGDDVFGLEYTIVL
jgi:hypothetical protein